MRVAAAVIVGLLVVVVAGCGGTEAVGDAPSTAPPPVAAPGRSDAFVIVADTPSGTASAVLAPGATAVLGLRVANASASARVFALRSTVPWLDVPARVSVPARQSVPVTATVRVDRDAPRAVMHGDVTASPWARSDSRVAVVYESRVPVSVRVVAP